MREEDKYIDGVYNYQSSFLSKMQKKIIFTCVERGEEQVICEITVISTFFHAASQNTLQRLPVGLIKILLKSQYQLLQFQIAGGAIFVQDEMCVKIPF